MADFEDDDLEWKPKKVNWAAFVLPLVTAAVALGVGVLAGVLAAMMLAADPVPIEVARDLTDAELEQVCKPLVANALTSLEDAQKKVETLQTQVANKETKVQELEKEMKRRGEKGKAIWSELKAARKELKTLRADLAQAVEEKEKLVVELKQTVEKLEETEQELVVTKDKLEVAKEDALKNRWVGFVQDAQLQICEKGNRKKLGRCREKVAASLTPDLNNKFRHCIKSGQAIPSIVEAEKKQKTIPEFSSWLNQDDKVTKGWYIMLCDPTLPEAEDLTEILRDLDGGNTFSNEPSGSGGLDDLDDLDDLDLDF